MTTSENVALDEAFLLFLADSLDKDEQVVDPLSMIEEEGKVDKTSKSNVNNEQTTNKEANDE